VTRTVTSSKYKVQVGGLGRAGHLFLDLAQILVLAGHKLNSVILAGVGDYIELLVLCLYSVNGNIGLNAIP
jgi:hypothetical protein